MDRFRYPYPQTQACRNILVLSHVVTHQGPTIFPQLMKECYAILNGLYQSISDHLDLSIAHDTGHSEAG